MNGVDGPGTDLPTAAERAAGWVRVRLPEFSPARAASLPERIGLLKPLSELVLVTNVLARDPAQRGLVDGWGSWAWSQLADGKELVHLLAARPDLVEVAGLVANFAELGLTDPPLHELVGQLAGLDATAALGLPEWRETALGYNLSRLGHRAAPPGVAARSWLARFPEPWTLTDATGYQLTHDVFYLTDFGRRPGALTAAARTYLRLWLPVWTAQFAAERNWDLVAELVAVGVCAGTGGNPDGDWLCEAARHLAAQQHADGSVPGPPGAGRPLMQAGDPAERTRFLASYHTTLVTLLAIGLTIQTAQGSVSLAPRATGRATGQPADHKVSRPS